jgi:ribA/ribD-fused uncharacterized protein
MQGPIESRTYRRAECAVFRKTDEPFGGLSNMAPGYSLCVNGIPVWTAEAIYQACRFPHRPDVQRLIINQTSPMTAKMRSKPYRDESRPDWESVRVAIMRWSLRVKLVQNWEKFRLLLTTTGEQPIVEDSRRDDFWGAVAMKDDPQILVGCNVLGRLLMELRERARRASADAWQEVKPPNIPDFLLFERPIGVVLKTDSPALNNHHARNAAVEAAG